MKIKVGNKLMSIREERKLNQNEMAELLGISPSSYGRIERNESTTDLEQVVAFSKTLNVPIQEFLPDTFSIHNNQPYGQGGLVFGNIYNYNDKTDQLKAMEADIKLKEQENAHLKKEIELLREMLEVLKEKSK